MDKDILSWSANEYETEGERKEAFDKFIEEFRTFANQRKILSLAEYKEEVSSFWKKVKEKLLVDCASNEVYSITNSFRNDISSDYGADIYASIFKKYENIEELIYRAEDNLEGNFEDSDEYLGDFCYWNITKYRLKNNDEYEMIFSVYQTYLNGYLEIYFNSDMVEEFTPIEKNVYNDWLRLSGIYSKERVTIKFPYIKGDILKVSGYPYQNNSQYYICYDENGNAISRDCFNRLCAKRLFSYCGVVGYRSFVPCHLEKLDSCEDKALCGIRKMILLSDDTVIEKLVEMLHHSLEMED